jgi:hypothetical protein
LSCVAQNDVKSLWLSCQALDVLWYKYHGHGLLYGQVIDLTFLWLDK